MSVLVAIGLGVLASFAVAYGVAALWCRKGCTMNSELLEVIKSVSEPKRSVRRRSPWARDARAVFLLARLSSAPVSVGDFVAVGWSPMRAFVWFTSRGLDPGGYCTCRDALTRGAPEVAWEVARQLWHTRREPREAS